MSDLAAFCAGIGIGLLIILPVAYVLRQEIADRARSLFREPNGEEDRSDEHDESGNSPSGENRTQGLSPLAVLISVSASILTFIWGLLSGGLIFTLSGAVLGIAVLLTFLAGRAARNA